MIITPKNAIELVLDKKNKVKPFRLYQTKLQKWLFWLTIVSIITCITLGISSNFFKNRYLYLTGHIFIYFALILMSAFQLISTGPGIIKMLNPEKEMSFNLLLDTFNEDLDLINELSRTFEIHHLRFAKIRYQQEAKQLRERIALLIGAIEKVGIIPLAITGYVSYSKIKAGGAISFSGIEWLLVSFIVLYLVMVRMIFTTQWMENIAEIFNEALKSKEKNANKMLETT
jgi:hypothetical protein